MQSINNQKIDGMNYTINMAQNNSYIHLQWEVIYLKNVSLAYNKSTVNIFGNEKCLRNIWSENGTITITTNAGNMVVNLLGIF